MNRIRQMILDAHRRSLWQVLAIYLVGSWVGYEVILSLTEGLGLPAWVPPFALVLFIIGLPMVLATAFVQEGMPAVGPSPTSEAPVAPPADTQEARPTSSRPALTWSRSIALGIAAFLVLTVSTGAYMGMRTLGIGPVGTLLAKGELDARQPLVVADFDGITGDSLLAVVIAEALRADLAQSLVVEVADRASVAEGLALMMLPADAPLDPATAREVAVRLGLKGVVEGEVGRAGAGYTLSARVVTADSGRTLASFRETAADSTAILDAIERLSHALRERVGESLGTVRASPALEAVTTPSLPALRKWGEATAIERRGGNRRRAIGLLEEAVSLDSAFAAAWRSLATLHYNDNRRAPTLRAIEKALAHQDRLPELPRRTARAFYANITGDLRAALAEHREIQALLGDSLEGLVFMSDVAWNLGDFEAAEAYARRYVDASEDPGWVAYWNLYVAQMDGGRIAEARRTAERLAAALPGVPAANLLLRSQYLNEGNHRAADTLPGWESESAILHGRLGAALRLDSDAAGPDGDRTADFRHALLRLQVVGDERAADPLAEALASGPPAWLPEAVMAELAVLMAMAGQPDAAARARAAYEERVPAEVRWNEAYLLYAAEAFDELHTGRPDSAFALFRRARASTPWTAPVDGLLGRAYELAGRPDSAVAAYTRYVETPWAYRAFDRLLADPRMLVPIHERLALLHDRMGDPDAAARHASRVVELWAEADAELQPRVAAMRRLLNGGAVEGGARR